MSKDQMTAHIASSLGLCPMKDYKPLSGEYGGLLPNHNTGLHPTVLSPKPGQQAGGGLLKPAPIRPNMYHTNGPMHPCNVPQQHNPGYGLRPAVDLFLPQCG